MTKNFVIYACLLSSLSSVCTETGLAADVSYVATSCDVIAVGTLTSRTESATNVSFDLSIQRVVRGATGTGAVHVSHPWARGGIGIASSRTITDTIEGLWCLQPAPSGEWDVKPINGPDGLFVSLFWPAAAALPAAYQAASVPLADALLFELAAGVEASGMNPEIAMGAARGAQSASLQIVINRFTASPSLDFQISGLAALLPVQASAISSVSGIWPSIKDNPRRFQVVFAIRDSFRDSSPASIQQLVQLASLSPELREASIHAISSIHSQASLPFLASLLTSSDPKEQARGVFGLSSFANVCPVQTPENVLSMAYLRCANDGPYSTADTIANFATPAPDSQAVSFWINWWKQHQSELQ